MYEKDIFVVVKSKIFSPYLIERLRHIVYALPYGFLGGPLFVLGLSLEENLINHNIRKLKYKKYLGME